MLVALVLEAPVSTVASSTGATSTSAPSINTVHKIERINKDMQLILYSPEYLGQHTILVHTQHTLGSLGLPYFCCSHTTLFVSFDESIYDLVACSSSKNGTGVHNKMSPSKDSERRAERLEC